jgi:hypothetical protein
MFDNTKLKEEEEGKKKPDLDEKMILEKIKSINQSINQGI